MAIGYGQTDGGDEIILSTLFFRGGGRPDSHHYVFFHLAEVMEGGFGGEGGYLGWPVTISCQKFQNLEIYAILHFSIVFFFLFFLDIEKIRLTRIGIYIFIIYI